MYSYRSSRKLSQLTCNSPSPNQQQSQSQSQHSHKSKYSSTNKLTKSQLFMSVLTYQKHAQRLQQREQQIEILRESLQGMEGVNKQFVYKKMGDVMREYGRLAQEIIGQIERELGEGAGSNQYKQSNAE